MSKSYIYIYNPGEGSLTITHTHANSPLEIFIRYFQKTKKKTKNEIKI